MHALRPAARVYVTVVVATASLVVAWAVAAAIGQTVAPATQWLPTTSLTVPADFWRAIVVLSLVYVVAASMPSPLSVPQAAIAATVPVLIASYLIAGPLAAAVVAASGCFAYSRWPPVKRAFNHSQFVLAAFCAGAVYTALGGAPARQFGSVSFGTAVLLPAFASSLVAVALNGLLMFGILSTAEGFSLRSVWRTVIADSVVPYLGYGLFGLLMAVLWSVVGGFGATLVLLPLLIARWAFRQYDEQQKAYEATIRAMVQAVETKDHYTRGHSERVSQACVRIANIQQMTADRVGALRYAGILHDVGKLSISRRLLQKTGPLDDEEFERIKKHPVVGTEMLRGIEFLQEAYEGILHHHERLDGLGYPMGLRGDEIPEFARVIAVADAFDSMTSTRSYRGARSVEQAIEELERCKATQFDPEMVDALIESLQRQPWRPAAQPVTAAVDGEVIEQFDHDDPTTPFPFGVDDALRRSALEAESAQLAALRRQDDA